MSEANKALVRRFVETVWNGGDLSVVNDFVGAEYALYLAGSTEPLRGPEIVKQGVTAFKSGFPDWHDAIDDLIAEGDKVAMRWTSYGTHQGAFHGVAPTGKRATLSGMDVFQIADGKIVNHWSYANVAGFLAQLNSTSSFSK